MSTVVAEPPVATPEPATPAVFDPAIHAEAALQYAASKGYKPVAEYQKEVDNSVRTAHETWERSFSEALGETKPDGVKGIDWAKEKITTLKTQPSPAPSSIDPVEKAKAEALVKGLNDRIAKLEAENKQEKEARVQLAKDTAINSAISGLSLKVEKEDELPSRQQAAATLLKSQISLEIDTAGKVIPYENGAPLIDVTTQEPYDLGKLAKERLSWMLAAEKPKPQGSGITPTDPYRVIEGKRIFVGKDSNEIYLEAAKQGLIAGSKDHLEFVRESAKASGVKL